MAEPFTIYKLTILYMLSKAGFPLTNTQIRLNLCYQLYCYQLPDSLSVLYCRWNCLHLHLYHCFHIPLLLLQPL